MPTHESKKFLNLSLIVLSLIKLMMFLYMKTLIMLMLFSGQARRHHAGDSWTRECRLWSTCM